jgi:hypothetical protein
VTDILVNKNQWDSLSEDEQNEIVRGLRGTGAIKIGDKIVGDPNVPPFDENTPLEPMWNPIKDICKAACDTTAAAAAAWCSANTAGVALAACLAAAEAARRECRKRC